MQQSTILDSNLRERKYAVRKIVALITLALAFLSSSVHALGLGRIEMLSALNQPLRAEIELLSVRDGETDGMIATLASKEAFLRAGIDRPFVLTHLRFAVSKRADGTLFIAVSSKKPIVEPFLNFLIEIDWPRGRLVREYTVLLDPPVFMTQQTESSQPAASQPAQTPIVESAIQTTQLTRPASTASTKTASGTTRYGPVKEGETLWSIARRTKPASMTIHQMMIAISRANQGAFLQNNIHLLRKDAILRIPRGGATVTQSEAVAAVRKQTALWNKYRNSVQRRNTGQAAQASARLESGTQRATAKSADANELKLVAEKEAAAKAADSVIAERTKNAEVALRSVQAQLALANEEIEAERLRNEELQSRIASLEETVPKMERLITLRESELAELQQKLAQAGIPTETSVATTPAPASPQVTRASKSFVDHLLQSPLFLIAGAGVLLLLLVLVFISIRRRRQADDEEDIYDESPLVINEGELPSLPDDYVVEQMDTSQNVQTSNDTEPPTVATDEAQDFVDAVDDGSQTEAEPSVEEDDVVAEADVYFAYGLFGQAEDLLVQAIKDAPDKAQYRVKLAETYFAEKNRDAFVVAAEKAHDAIAQSDPEAWEKIAAMGSELAPDNQLFGGAGFGDAGFGGTGSTAPLGSELELNAGDLAGDANLDLERESAFDELAGDELVGNELEGDGLADYGLADLGQDDGATEGDTVLEDVLEGTDDELTLDDPMEFGTEELDTGETVANSVSDDESTVLDFDNDIDMDLNLEDLSLTDTTETTDTADSPDVDQIEEFEDSSTATALPDNESVAWDQAVDTTSEQAAEAPDDEFDFEGGDGVETMLDLAKAYINMGDTDSAIDALNEIITTGNDTQQAEAQALLKELSF